MLTIKGPGGVRPPERKSIRPSLGNSGFHVPISGGAGAPSTAINAGFQPAGIAEAGAAGNATAIPAARDNAVQKHGEDILDVLAQLQRDMLLPDRDPAMFHRLAALADAIPEAASPGLRLAMREVATRAQVELAREQVASLGRQMTAAK